MTQKLQPGAVSVAIIDYDLYGPDVFQAIKEIKQDYESLSILALINRTTPSCLLRSLQVGVAGYLLKTATSDEIVNAVRAVYSGEAVLDLQSVYELIHHVDYSVDKQGYIGEGQRLRQRELEVLKLASKGLSNKEIARRLFLSERTVQSHFSMIFERLGVASRTKAVLEAWRNGWITNDDLVD